jgi:Tol biopolymer transport system component
MMAFVNYPRDRDSDIVLTRPDFSSLKRVAKTPNWIAFGSWSPDGNTIVFTQTTATEAESMVDLYTLNIHTGDIRQLTDTPRIAEHAAVYSPDEKKSPL